MVILKMNRQNIQKGLAITLLLFLSSCSTRLNDTADKPLENQEQPRTVPIDVSKITSNDELAEYLGKPVYVIGTAQSSKSSTRAGGFEIWSNEGYIWPFEVVGQTVKVVGIMDFHDFGLERKRLKERNERGLMTSQRRGYPDGVDGAYVIRGEYWCLWDDDSRTKRLFETDPLSDEEIKSYFP